MPYSEVYRAQVALLIRTLPAVAEEECFALKGGTAINFFVRNLPRLSVDIDLTFLPMADRGEALDRQHPRDLFDIDLLMKDELSDEVRTAFVVYLVSHDRPPNRLLTSANRTLTQDYENDFRGMTDDEVHLDTLLAARTALIEDLLVNMPEDHKHFLVSFYHRKNGMGSARTRRY